MAPNKFDINRTPGVKPGLKNGDIISDLTQIKTNDNPETVKLAMLTFDSFVRNGPYFAVQTVGKYIKTTSVILGDEEDKPDVPGDREKQRRMKFVATIDVNKGAYFHGTQHSRCLNFSIWLQICVTSLELCMG